MRQPSEHTFSLFLSLLCLTCCSPKTVGEVGVLKQKSLAQVHNNLAVGCETLDRDYADYDAYKEYLAPLGMRYIRLQAGWAKCEKEKGVYDLGWLDHIIDDAVSRGLEPWLELSYGNPIYPGGGSAFLAGGWPRGEEALEAWKAWTRELAERYNGKVHSWEIWNEPDNHFRSDNKDPEEIAQLVLESARIIKGVDPDSKIAAFGLGRARRDNGAYDILAALFSKLKASGEEYLIDYISYHGYHYLPEDSYFVDGRSLKTMLDEIGWDVKIWQGECGAPSVGYMGGAIAEYGWTEISQAKWALRKILCDHAHGIRTSIFSIADMNYAPTDEIKKKNYKGLLLTDDKNAVIRPKMAYAAVRNLVSVFDNLDIVCDSTAIKSDGYLHYLFTDDDTGFQSAVIWKGGGIPSDRLDSDYIDITVRDFRCRRPVCVDLLSGRILRLFVRKHGRLKIFPSVPCLDSPIIICDASLFE